MLKAMALPDETMVQDEKDGLYLTVAQRAMGWHVHGWGVGTVIRKDGDAGGVMKWIKPALGRTPFGMMWCYGINEGASLIRLRLEQDGFVPKQSHVMSTTKPIGYCISPTVAIREVEQCAMQRRLELIEAGVDLSRLAGAVAEAGKSFNALLSAAELAALKVKTVEATAAWKENMLGKMKFEPPIFINPDWPVREMGVFAFENTKPEESLKKIDPDSWEGYHLPNVEWPADERGIEKSVDDKPYMTPMSDEEGI